MASSTKNTKANRKVVVAEYHSPESVFEIPHGLDLEDTTVVEWWAVKYNCLHIKYVGIDQVEDVEPVWDAMESCDLKYPSNCTIEDVDVVGYEYTDDTDDEDSEEEKEESIGDQYSWELCTKCEAYICIFEHLRTQDEFEFTVPDGHYCEACSAKMTAKHEADEELICGENNGGGRVCSRGGVVVAVQFGCECGEEEDPECDYCAAFTAELEAAGPGILDAQLLAASRMRICLADLQHRLEARIPRAPHAMKTRSKK